MEVTIYLLTGNILFPLSELVLIEINNLPEVVSLAEYTYFSYHKTPFLIS